MSKKQFTANDNAPDRAGQHIGFGSPTELRHTRVTERPSIIVSQTPAPGDYTPVWTPKLQRAKPAKPKPASTPAYIITAMVWAGAIISNMAAIVFAPANTIHLLVVIAAIWSSLAMIYVAQSRAQTILAEMASLAAISAFGLSLYVTSMRFGIATGPASGAALGAFAAAGLGFITGSKLALRISAFAALAWAAITLTGPSLNVSALVNGALPKPGLAWLAFPALLTLQAFAMARHRDGAALSVSVLAAYILAIGGLAGLVLAGQVSPILAAGGLLLGGLAHNRAGKLLGSRDKFGSALHVGAGTGAMLMGLIALQDFWTLPSRAIWIDALPGSAQLAAGLALGALLLGLIFVLDLSRARLSVSRAAKAALSVAMAGAVIYFSAKSQILSAPLAAYGLQAAPLIGIALAGTVLALGLGLIANGFRRQISGFVAIGALAISASVFLVLPVITTGLEAGAVYAAGTFVSALIGASFITVADAPQPLPYASAND